MQRRKGHVKFIPLPLWEGVGGGYKLSVFPCMSQGNSINDFKDEKHPAPYPRPQGAGKKLLAFAGSLLLLSACGPTYKRETLKESIQEMARKEYKLDVEVVEVGQTVGIRWPVKNFIGELVAPDQWVLKKIDDLMMVLHRVSLSVDVPPTFVVLDVLDEQNPSIHLVFTRYVHDVKRIMVEDLSRNQYFDRLLIELMVGNKRLNFDPSEMDMIRLMMMGMDFLNQADKKEPEFQMEDVSFPNFLAQVTANSMKRILKEEKEINDNIYLKDVKGSFDSRPKQGTEFEILLDLVTKPSAKLSPQWLELKVLPLVSEEVGKIFRSYKYDGFSKITVLEKNSGKLITVPRQ